MLEKLKNDINDRLFVVNSRIIAIEKELEELKPEYEALKVLSNAYSKREYDSIDEERNVTLGYNASNVTKLNAVPYQEVAVTRMESEEVLFRSPQISTNVQPIILSVQKKVGGKRSSKIEERSYKVLDILQAKGDMTISELKKETGYPQSQVSIIVYRLVDEKMVELKRTDGIRKYFGLVD